MKMKMRFFGAVIMGILVGSVLVPSLSAKDLTVAVFNFESEDAVGGNVGSKIGELVSVQLSQEKGIRLVERARLDEITKELGLSLSGAVAEGQALKVGSLAGAKILIIGRVFPADKDLIITAKIIGTETSRVKSVMVKTSGSEELSKITSRLSSEIINVLRREGNDFIALDQAEADIIEKIKAGIKGKPLPVVGVVISEKHGGREIVDPAVATEVIFVLTRCGFEVREEDKNTPAWLKSDVVINGEGLSGFAGHRGDLISASARVEIKAVAVKKNKVIAVARTTKTAVGLSEEITAKTALQEATRKILVDFIPEMVANWSKVK